MKKEKNKNKSGSLLPAFNPFDPKDIQLKVCPNSKIESNLSWNFSCQDNGAQTVVKVVWKYKTKIQNPEQKTQQEKNLEILDEDNKVTLSYQVPLSE